MVAFAAAGIARPLGRAYFRYAKVRPEQPAYPLELRIRQDLRPNAAKVLNLRLAQAKIEKYSIAPGELFSFWKAVGALSRQNGFRESRSLLGKRIEKSVGGGLCQLSGSVYYSRLMAGLKIVERHSHSLDIYDETTRFTPLGSNATVVYGYKDVQVQNNTGQPLQFRFVFEPEHLSIQLCAPASLPLKTVQFRQEQLQDGRIAVETLVEGEVLERSIYRKLLAVD